MNYDHNFAIQPIIDIASDSICGGEVLWRPNGSSLTEDMINDLDNDPALNLQVAKESYILALDVLSLLNSDAWISINLSSKFIGNGNNLMRSISREVEDLEMLRKQYGKNLVIELSERCIVQAKEMEFLQNLSDFHPIAIDDFGAGIAPLKNMVELNFEKIKVDKSVIQGIDFSKTKQRFMRWLVSGCHEIQVDVCAEGIETSSELIYCKRIGVDQGQGYLWSKAINTQEFIASISTSQNGRKSTKQSKVAVNQS